MKLSTNFLLESQRIPFCRSVYLPLLYVAWKDTEWVAVETYVPFPLNVLPSLFVCQDYKDFLFT